VLNGRQDGLVDGNTYSYRSSRRDVFGVLHNFQRHIRVVPFPSKHLRTSEDRCHYPEIKLGTGLLTTLQRQSKTQIQRQTMLLSMVSGPRADRLPS